MTAPKIGVSEEIPRKGGLKTNRSLPFRDATISLAAANGIGVLLLPVGALIMILPFWLTWGKEALGVGFMSVTHWYISLPVFLFFIAEHEIVHAIGYIRFGKAMRGDVQFGMNWKALIPYAHCRATMNARAYRIAVALPGLLLGVIPFLAAMLLGSGVLAVWGFILTVAAGGDAAILWAIRDVSGTELVRDHPSRAGCEILSSAGIQE